MVRDYRAQPLTDEERRSIQVLRAIVPISDDLTDEEIADGTDRFVAIARQSTISMADATAAFSSLAKAFSGNV